MLFNSVPFAVFLPIVLVIYWWLPTPRRQNQFLIAASLFFYGWWDWRFVSLILLSTGVDFYSAQAIERDRARGGMGKRWLWLSLLVNLGALGFFKYFNFFVDSIAPLWIALGWQPRVLEIALPVGISFYTFQTLSYTIDVYRGRFAARSSLVDFATYVTFFPQLVAGPIERASRLLPQLERTRTVTLATLRTGLLLIFVGYMKKLLIADGIAPVVDSTFGQVALGRSVSSGDLWMGAYAFTLQIYGDFSGYSDIARGVGKLLGIELVVNFRQPFFAHSITDLWRRWHISLSQWLRDYLYIPLGGNRHGDPLTYRNLMLTMLIGGLWHGAAWTFVVWGGLHGLFLLVERRFRWGERGRHGRGVLALRMLLTFHLVVLAFVFFRADSFATAWVFLTEIATLDSLPRAPMAAGVAIAAGLTLLYDLPHLWDPEGELPLEHSPRWLGLTLGVSALALYLAPPVDAASFIYFQF